MLHHLTAKNQARWSLSSNVENFLCHQMGLAFISSTMGFKYKIDKNSRFHATYLHFLFTFLSTALFLTFLIHHCDVKWKCCFLMLANQGYALLTVLIFDQHLGAAHPKRWLKYAFLKFVMAKSTKKHSTSILGQTKKKRFLLNFAAKLLLCGFF